VAEAVAVAVAVAMADAEPDACGVRDGEVTAEAEGSAGWDGRAGPVGTGVADAEGVGAPPPCWVQPVPSQVQVSPTTSPVVDVDPSSSPPKRTTCLVEPSYARAGSVRAGGAPEDGAFTHAAEGVVDAQRTPEASRPTTSPAPVSVTGAPSK